MLNQTNVRDDLLRRFSALSLANANEAETRKKLIDEVLERLLGWSIDDISYEERVSEDGETTFADYILRTVSGSLLIEAKRVGAAFTQSSTKRREKLSERFLEGTFGKAVTQARDYCRKKSIPFAVVTNGHQWVVFPAVRTDQVSFSDSSAIVFSSLQDILGSDFDYFFSLLSRDGVVNGTLGIELTGRSGDQIEERRLNKSFQSTAQTQINPVYPLIENEINTAFSEAVNFAESSIIEKCYVRTADRTKFDNRIKMHLAKREAVFSSRPPNPMRSRDAKVFDDALARTMESGRPLAILVLGPVGAGKTTYLHYTRKVSSATYFEARKDADYPHWIYVDFRGFKSGDSPSKFIFEKVFLYMQEDTYFSEFERGVRTGYRTEIAALRSGPLALIARRDEAAFETRVSALVRCSSSHSFQYVDGPTIQNHLRTLGISDDHTLQALHDLCSFRMIHTASHTEPDFQSNYYPSRYGGYVVRDLITSFTFVENVLMDTFISSDNVWSKLFELSKGIRETRDSVARLKLRIERAKHFYAYVASLYDDLLIEAQRRGLPSEWCANPLVDSQRAFRFDCARALRSAKNGKRRAENA